MKEEIKQILKENAWEMEKNRYVIGLSNIDNIADEVVKLFCQPPVSGSVCVSCDEQKEIHELCMDCVKKMIADNQQTIR